MLAVVERAMAASGESNFLLDGFPRTPENVQTFENWLAASNGRIVCDGALPGATR